jgi:hypothetical protein
MSDLEELLPEDCELIVGLPYRAGMWVSRADTAPGDADQEPEMQALERVIRHIAQMHLKCGFVHDVANETVGEKQHWPRWRAMADFEKDCARAMTLLKDLLTPEDLKTYRAMVMHVAKAVAMAYGEQGVLKKDHSENLIATFLAGLIEKLTGKSADKPSPENISAKEMSALKRLGEFLRF